MKYIHTSSFFFLKIVIFCASYSVACGQDSLKNSLPMYEIEPIEIKAIRVGDRSPFSTSNLQAKTIKDFNGVQDFTYLLNQTPSVVSTSDAGIGVGYTGLRIRGTDDSRINFTVNGIPINNAESQQTYFVNLPDLIGSTNSIQIQRGVGSSTNGSASFGASVNMSTLTQSDKPYAAFSTTAGSFKTLKNSILLGTGKLKSGFQFDVRLSKITSDGYIYRSESDLKSLQFLSGWSSKNEKTSIKFNLLTGKEKTGQSWDGVPEDSLKTNRRYNGLGLMRDGRYYSNQTDNYQQDYYQLFVNHQFKKYWDIHTALFLTRGRGYYDEYRMDEPFSDYHQSPYITPSGDTLITTDLTRQLWLDNYFFGATFSLNYKRNKTQATWGGSITKYNGKHYGFVTWADYGFAKDESWYHLTAFKNDYSIYGKIQQKIGSQFYLIGDLQYRHINYIMNGFRKNPQLNPHVVYNFFNPKIGLSYYMPSNHSVRSKLYAYFAVAQKEPNRDDFESAVSKLPKPEKLFDTEWGYEVKATQWNMAFNGFYMLYKDQLILTGKINDVGEYTRQNVPTSYRTGIEWNAEYRPISAISLDANATFSKSKIKDFHEYIDNYDAGNQLLNIYPKTQIAFSPDWIAYGSISYQPFMNKWENQQLFFQFSTKYVGRQYLDNTTHKDRSIGPYTLSNLNIRYQLSTRIVKNIALHMNLINIFNKKYVSNGYTFSYIYGGNLTTENYYFPQAGTQILFGLDVQF